MDTREEVRERTGDIDLEVPPIRTGWLQRFGTTFFEGLRQLHAPWVLVVNVINRVTILSLNRIKTNILNPIARKIDYAILYYRANRTMIDFAIMSVQVATLGILYIALWLMYTFVKKALTPIISAIEDYQIEYALAPHRFARDGIVVRPWVLKALALYAVLLSLAISVTVWVVALLFLPVIAKVIVGALAAYFVSHSVARAFIQRDTPLNRLWDLIKDSFRRQPNRHRHLLEENLLPTHGDEGLRPADAVSDVVGRTEVLAVEAETNNRSAEDLYQNLEVDNRLSQPRVEHDTGTNLNLTAEGELTQFQPS